MDFRILGPLEVEENGRPLAPGGRKARAVLAVLLIHANEPVSPDRLVEDVWGGELPENAAKSLQIHISRLRKTLGERLRTTAQGSYELALGSGELDRDRALELVRRGGGLLDAGDPAAAAAAFGDALSLFRGRPLEEFSNDEFARAEIVRLEDLRFSAAEGRFDAELALGNGARLVGELESVSAASPLRERFREQLMVALYQAGRQADALEVYADARRTFSRELGIEPGPALRDLERRILNQDPALQPRSRMLRRPVRRTRGPSILLGAAAAAAVLVGAAAWLSGESAVSLPPRSLGLLDPETLELKAVVPLGGSPTDIAVGRRSIFVSLPTRRSVLTLDPATRATATVGAAIRPGLLAESEQGLWLLDGRPRRAALLGSERIHVIEEARERGSAPLDAFASSGPDIWLAERHAEIVFRLDVPSGRSSAVENGGRDSFFEGDARRALAVAAGSVWVSNPVTTPFSSDRLGRVSRIDAETGEVTARIRLPAPPVAIVADADAVWVALERGESLWRIDPRDDVASAAVRLDGAVTALALGERAVWALGPSGRVSRIDPATDTVTRRVELGRGSAIAAGHGGVWIATR